MASSAMWHDAPRRRQLGCAVGKGLASASMHDGGETLLLPGMCAGFVHGGTAHHLINHSNDAATYLEIGDRQIGDSISYPEDNLVAVRSDDGWLFTDKDGRPY